MNKENTTVESDGVGTPIVSALYYPRSRESGGYWVGDPTPQAVAGQDPSTIPLPPYPLRLGYGYDAVNRRWDDKAYLASGKMHIATMLEALRQNGFKLQAGQRVMEIGCSSGRMTRWLLPHTTEADEVWGIDVHSEAIMWAQQNIPLPLNFFTSTTAPHVPFPDAYFDLIYAGSVFTHIGELADAWFLEVRRLLKPGGHAFLTIFDDTSMEQVLADKSGRNAAKAEIEAFDRHHNVLGSPYGVIVMGASIQRTRVIYRSDFIRRKLRAVFDVKGIVPDVYGWQSALILRRRGD